VDPIPHPGTKGEDGIARYRNKPAGQEEIFLTNGTKSSPSMLPLYLLHFLIWKKSPSWLVYFGKAAVMQLPTGAHCLPERGKGWTVVKL